MEQTGSLFTPHPLLPHGNACYYSQIILNSLPLLLFSELFRHNYLTGNSFSQRMVSSYETKGRYNSYVLCPPLLHYFTSCNMPD